MSTIICLHTAHSNAAVFDQAAAALGWPAQPLAHHVHEDLLRQAEAAAGMDEALRERTTCLLDTLAGQADAVLLTCSTLGPAVSHCRSAHVWRADAMLAARVASALAHDGAARIALLCAAPTTYEATGALFFGALQARVQGDSDGDRDRASRLQLQCVPGAWQLFRSGDASGYAACLDAAARQAYADGATQVALTQVSMEGVASRWAEAGSPWPVPWTVAASALQHLRQARP